MERPKLVGGLALLTREHGRLKDLFAQLENAEDEEVVSELVTRLGWELAIHIAVEERVFLPAAHEALEGDERVRRAMIAHRNLRHLLDELDGTALDDELLGARLAVLERYVDQHVRDAETKLFPEIVKCGLDLLELETDLAAARARLEETVTARESDRVIAVPQLPPHE